MNQENGNSNYFDSTSLFEFFWRWRKQLFIIVVVAGIVSVAVSYLIHERYKSTVIMFPVQSNAISKALLTDDMSGKQDVLQYGEEEQAEQMLQILYSDEIRQRICDKYKLMQHYRIDPNDRYKNTRLYEIYSENISFKRTEFLSVKIEVLDESPDTAAFIANDIAALLDSTKMRIQQDRALQAFNIVESAYLTKQADVQRMTDSMRTLNQLGVFDVETQSEHLNELYFIALSKNDERAIKALDVQRKVLADYGSAYTSVRENLYIQREQLNLLKKKYEEAKIDKDEALTYKFIVNKGYKAERKSYPVRWLIVAVTTISSLVFGVLLLILYDNIKTIRSRNKTPREVPEPNEKKETTPQS